MGGTGGADEGAKEGDFCQPAGDPQEIGRCENGFDCWGGNACTVGICDASGGTCSQDNAPNRT